MPSPSSSAKHPVTAYAKAVLRGKVPAGRLQILACQRHLSDLDRAKKKAAPIRFDEAAADRAIKFFSLLKHSKGKWAGQPFELAPWQSFVLGCLFGWKRTTDDARRFRTAYNEVPRKNGKSTLSAGTGLRLAFFDGEQGAEVYCLDPTTPILKADLTWSSLSTINVGDELLGFDEAPPSHKKQRKMKPSRVLGKVARHGVAVRIRTAAGREVICSPEHKWLTKAPSSINMKFREAQELRPGHRMLILADPWETEFSHIAGYLAGFLDGEGFLHSPKATGAAFRVGFGQLPGVVFDAVMEALWIKGFRPKVPRVNDHSGCLYSEVSGLADSLRLLGSFRPLRLLARARDLWVGKKAAFECDTITAIEALPAQELIDIETESSTFIAAGFGSHNCAATKREQAKIVFDEAARMREKTPELKKRITAFVGNLHVKETASKLQPLGADADSTDGLNIHGAIVDELHAHKTRAMVDVLETATSARRQPLVFYITTAGTDRESVCWQFHEYAVKVLEGVVEDDTFFAFIACTDEADDWTDPKTWAKANPNLGISVHLDDLKRKCERAKQIPSEQNAFRRLHCNEWTESVSVWIPDEIWMRGGKAVEEQALMGRECFFGLDLGQTRDLTALAAVFPDRVGGYDVLMRFWCPKDQIAQRAQRDRAPYDVWAEQGLLIPTEGEVSDLDFVEAEVLALAKRFKLVELAYDPYRALQIITHLKDQLGEQRVVEFGQGFKSMAGPTKELERLAVEGKLRHGGNPVLRWMNRNVAIRQDPAGNLKIDKEKSAEKVDGMVALAMALGRAMVSTAPPPNYLADRFARGEEMLRVL